MMVRRLMIFLIIMSFPNYTTDWLKFFHSKWNYSNKKLSWTFCIHILFIILLKLRRCISCTIFSLSANNNWKIRYTTWHFWCYLSSNIINRRTKHIQLLDTRRKVPHPLIVVILHAGNLQETLFTLIAVMWTDN